MVILRIRTAKSNSDAQHDVYAVGTWALTRFQFPTSRVAGWCCGAVLLYCQVVPLLQVVYHVRTYGLSSTVKVRNSTKYKQFRVARQRAQKTLQPTPDASCWPFWLPMQTIILIVCCGMLCGDNIGRLNQGWAS